MYDVQNTVKCKYGSLTFTSENSGIFVASFFLPLASWPLRENVLYCIYMHTSIHITLKTCYKGSGFKVDTEVFGGTGFGNNIFSEITDILAIPNLRFCVKKVESKRFSGIRDKIAFPNWSGTSENLCNYPLDSFTIRPPQVKQKCRGFRKYPISWGWSFRPLLPKNLLLWALLMQNFKLGMAKMSVTPENRVFLNPALPKTSVFLLSHHCIKGKKPSWPKPWSHSLKQDFAVL